MKKNRLETVLDILDAKPHIAKHHRHNLVSAIYLFAGINKDKELESQCEVLLASIKNESV